MICKKCGGKIKQKHANFCPHCQVKIIHVTKEPDANKKDILLAVILFALGTAVTLPLVIHNKHRLAAAALAGIIAILYFSIIETSGKNKNWTVLISVLLSCVLMFPVASFFNYSILNAGYNAQIEASRHEIESLRHESEKLTADVYDKKQQLEIELNGLQIKIEKLRGYIDLQEEILNDSRQPEETAAAGTSIEETAETQKETDTISEQ